MLKNYYAILTKFYGAEVRGGAVSSGIIISDKEILFQFVRKPDFILGLHEKGLKEHAPKEANIVIVDNDLVKQVSIKCKKIIRLPIIKTAEKIGSQKVANIVLLGVFSKFSDIIDKEDLSRALKTLGKSELYELNLRAVEEGAKLVKSM